jgi:hypothetical protein
LEQLQKIQNAGRKAAAGSSQGNRISSCHSETRNSWTEPLKSVTPKTQICWLVLIPLPSCGIYNLKGIRLISPPNITGSLQHLTKSAASLLKNAAICTSSTPRNLANPSICAWENPHGAHSQISCRPSPQMSPSPTRKGEPRRAGTGPTRNVLTTQRPVDFCMSLCLPG